MGTARSIRIVMIQLERAAVDQSSRLVRLATLLLARALARQRLLGAAPIAWLQVERMLLDILDDIFLLHLPLEAAKRALDRLAFLNLDFSQSEYTPFSGHACHEQTRPGDQPLPQMLCSPRCPL